MFSLSTLKFYQGIVKDLPNLSLELTIDELKNSDVKKIDIENQSTVKCLTKKHFLFSLGLSYFFFVSLLK
jgi:hypothetical protein